MTQAESLPSNFGEMIVASYDGNISPEQRAQLDDLLLQNPAARTFYVDFMVVMMGMRQLLGDAAGQQDEIRSAVGSTPRRLRDNPAEHIQAISGVSADKQEAVDILKSFESGAFRQVVEQDLNDSAMRRALQEAAYDWETGQTAQKQSSIIHSRRCFTRREIIQNVWRIAAVLLFAIGLIWLDRQIWRYAGQTVKPDRPVATLSQRMGEFTEITSSGLLEVGSELYPAGFFLKRSGFAELTFDSDTKVVLEGPAEFQLLSENAIRLNYGRLYAMVSREAIGFTVNTASSQIIDLGTEFGVEVDLQGDTSLHVVKGKTILIAGEKSNRVSVEVNRGVAKKISMRTQAISDISYDDRLFVRKIYSTDELIWRGETRISLADIVGGGNGFGGGRLDEGIDVATGGIITDLMDDTVKVGVAGYRSVDDRRFVDGVFVPGLEEGMTRIASDGSTLVKFPKTSGLYWGYMLNGAFHQGDSVPKHLLELDGVVFGNRQNPALSIHSNQGITFDLSEIRNSIPEGTITQLQSLIGISETVMDYVDGAESLDPETLSKTTFSTVSFWVFLDGRKACEIELSNNDEPVRLEIPIRTEDRFLTLAVTESGDVNAFDWALFGRPELVIEFAQ